MAKKSSTMSPKRLFILLCLAGALMWFFSNSSVEMEVSVDTNKEKTEEVDSVNQTKEEQIQKEEVPEVKKKKKKKKKKKQNDQQQTETQNDEDYLKKRELDYDPNSRNN